MAGVVVVAVEVEAVEVGGEAAEAASAKGHLPFSFAASTASLSNTRINNLAARNSSSLT
jgi:hypothetical protein